MTEEKKQTPPSEEKDKPASNPEEGAGEKGGDNKNPEEEVVQISKKEQEEFTGLKGRQSELTKREQAVAKKEKKLAGKKPTASKKSESGFSFENPDEPTEEELNQRQKDEEVSLGIGVRDLLLGNPDYQEVVKQNDTLGKVLRNNPLSLLDDDPVDADDALEQIKEMLDEKVKLLKKDDKKDDKGEKDKKKEEKDGKQEPKSPPPTGEKTKAPHEQTQKGTLHDVEKGIMGKINVGGKEVT